MFSVAGESWSMKEEDKIELNAFENNCLRTTVCVYRKNHIKMDHIRSDTGIPNKITGMIKNKRLRPGHVNHREPVLSTINAWKNVPTEESDKDNQ